MALHQDELQPLAQDRLHGALVPRIRPQHVRDQSIDPVAPALVLVAQQDRLHPAPVTLEVLLQLEQGGEAAAPVGQLLAQPDEQLFQVAALGEALLQLLLARGSLLVQRPPARLRLGKLSGKLLSLP